MKTALFVSGAVPGVDKYLCKKSQFYIDELIAKGEAVMLPASAYHRPAAQLLPPKSVRAESGDLNAVSAPEDLATNSSISEREVKANAGVADSEIEIFRARAKVRAWMSKATSDERNPLPRGKWADLSGIQVVAVQ
jgi:hypothetical protein